MALDSETLPDSFHAVIEAHRSRLASRGISLEATPLVARCWVVESDPAESANILGNPIAVWARATAVYAARLGADSGLLSLHFSVDLVDESDDQALAEAAQRPPTLRYLPSANDIKTARQFRDGELEDRAVFISLERNVDPTSPPSEENQAF